MKIYKNRYIPCILITLTGVLTFSFTNETFINRVKNSIFPNITAAFYSQIVFYVYNISNPFNPVTKIKFDIPSNVKNEKSNAPLSFGEGLGVRLIIYDFLGREIAILVNEGLKPGTYIAEWDASDFLSGVYFYQLSIDNEQLAVRKMVLLK